MPKNIERYSINHIPAGDLYKNSADPFERIYLEYIRGSDHVWDQLLEPDTDLLRAEVCNFRQTYYCFSGNTNLTTKGFLEHITKFHLDHQSSNLTHIQSKSINNFDMSDTNCITHIWSPDLPEGVPYIHIKNEPDQLQAEIEEAIEVHNLKNISSIITKSRYGNWWFKAKNQLIEISSSVVEIDSFIPLLPKLYPYLDTSSSSQLTDKVREVLINSIKN